MAAKSHAAIGLGSNQGDRLAYLERATAAIDRIHGVSVVASSHVFESKGWGRDDLDPFLNAVIAARIDNVAPEDLLAQLLEIEHRMGRVRRVKWGPRIIDLDLLALDDQVVKSPGLTLPHPWISRRPFVYLPMREILAVDPRWKVLTESGEEGRRIEADSRALGGAGICWGMAADPVSSVTLRTRSEEETQELGRVVGRWLRPGDVVALEGEMGAGKSVLARGMARGQDITGPIQSPTFTLCRRYEGTNGALAHWDFYRLTSEDDLESTGFASEEETIRIIEWADMFPSACGEPGLRVRIDTEDADTRRIRLDSAAGASLPWPARAAAVDFQRESAREAACH